MAESPSPMTNLSLDPRTGVMQGHTRRYEKRLDELAGVYQDADAWRDLATRGTHEIAYEVFECRASHDAGDLVFGTTVLHPVLIGREFGMTRGHRHRIADRAEFYHALAGQGVLVLHADDGRAWVEPLVAGSVAYVPPHTSHRAVNVGDAPLSFMFCYPADAGQDYAVIEREGGMPILIVTDPAGGWRTEPNPAYGGAATERGAALQPGEKG